MAETARDRLARMERKLRGMEAEIASLRAMYDGLLAGRRERDVEDAWWFPLVPIGLGTAAFAGIFLLAKYF